MQHKYTADVEQATDMPPWLGVEQRPWWQVAKLDLSPAGPSLHRQSSHNQFAGPPRCPTRPYCQAKQSLPSLAPPYELSLAP